MLDLNTTASEINMLKAAIERGKTDRARAEANKENYEKRQAEIDAEIVALGFAPDNLEADIEELGQKLASTMAEAKALIPTRYLQG